MWTYKYFSRIDFRTVAVIMMLMLISLAVISSNTAPPEYSKLGSGFFTPYVKSQIKWFIIGWMVFLFLAGFDYHKLREWTWFLYLAMIIALIGLFFASPIQRVYRWYRIPIVNMSVQPSEFAKLIIVMALSWLLERRRGKLQSWSTVLLASIVVGIPFLLILKQPDLGTAMVLYPIILAIFYFGDFHKGVLKTMCVVGIAMLMLIMLIFSGILPYEKIKPCAKIFMKDYQIERLNPDSHHQRAAVTAIGIGGIAGSGWKKNDFSSRGWLPANYTDSVFSAFTEEFGLIGAIILIGLFYSLIHFGFKATASAKDYFGQLLSAGINIYLTMHIIFNFGMMCGLLPITGVPLIIISYGGSSLVATMAALGILQSIYSRRFMF